MEGSTSPRGGARARSEPVTGERSGSEPTVGTDNCNARWPTESQASTLEAWSSCYPKGCREVERWWCEIKISDELKPVPSCFASTAGLRKVPQYKTPCFYPVLRSHFLCAQSATGISGVYKRIHRRGVFTDFDLRLVALILLLNFPIIHCGGQCLSNEVGVGTMGWNVPGHSTTRPSAVLPCHQSPEMASISTIRSPLLNDMSFSSPAS